MLEYHKMESCELLNLKKTNIKNIIESKKSTISSDVIYNNNHFFELLKRMYISNNKTKSIEPLNIRKNKIINQKYWENINIVNNNDSLLDKCEHINLQTLTNYLKIEVMNKTYLNINSEFYSLVFNDTDDFLVVSTNEINENLRHIDPLLDRVLHQMKYVIFEKPSFTPICYLEKSIKESALSYSKTNNSYLKSYVFDNVKNYNTKEFDKHTVSIYRHYIGSYIIMFFCKDKWFFVLHNNIHEFNCNMHPVLYEHIGSHINKFDKTVCYHLVIVDTRLRRLIIPTTETNYVVLIKITEKYTLNKKQIPCTSTLIHDVLVCDKRIYFSCLDELHVMLEELDIINSKTKRLLNRGYIVQMSLDDFDDINISYDTLTYKRLISMVPLSMTIHEVHLYLYQSDKLNYFLQYVTDTYTDVVKRINMSMSTLSREILDIYHMTRKKKNSELYNILPQSYKLILYQLHSNYIVQKNKQDNPEKLVQPTNNLYTLPKFKTHNDTNFFEVIDSQLALQNVSPCDKTIFLGDNDDKYDNVCIKNNYSDDSGDVGDGKVSISVDNVYIKLKDLELYSLVDLYKDREELIKILDENNNLINPIKQCTNTKIQSKLLSMKSPI
jgi:hypothetical protein